MKFKRNNIKRILLPLLLIAFFSVNAMEKSGQPLYRNKKPKISVYYDENEKKIIAQIEKQLNDALILKIRATKDVGFLNCNTYCLITGPTDLPIDIGNSNFIVDVLQLKKAILQWEAIRYGIMPYPTDQ